MSLHHVVVLAGCWTHPCRLVQVLRAALAVVAGGLEEAPTSARAAHRARKLVELVQLGRAGGAGRAGRREARWSRSTRWRRSRWSRSTRCSTRVLGPRPWPKVSPAPLPPVSLLPSILSSIRGGRRRRGWSRPRRRGGPPPRSRRHRRRGTRAESEGGRHESSGTGKAAHPTARQVQARARCCHSWRAEAPGLQLPSTAPSTRGLPEGDGASPPHPFVDQPAEVKATPGAPGAALAPSAGGARAGVPDPAR